MTYESSNFKWRIKNVSICFEFEYADDQHATDESEKKTHTLAHNFEDLFDIVHSKAL